jgi:hypothetical protein
MNISIDSLLAYSAGNPEVGNRFNRRINTVGDKTYIGYSSDKVLEDSAKWFIKLITDDGNGSISIEHANNVKWTERAAVTYI